MCFSATDMSISFWLRNYWPSNRLLWWWVLFTHTCSQVCCFWSDRGLSLHREPHIKKITVTKHVAVGGNKWCQGANIDGWFLMWYFWHFSSWLTEMKRGACDGKYGQREGGYENKLGQSISHWREGETVIQMDRVAVWQRVFTAEPKLKKPRPLSHTPLAPKLYGLLHSTHKQPAGNVRERQAGGTAGWKQQLAFLHQHDHSKTGDKAAQFTFRWDRREIVELI